MWVDLCEQVEEDNQNTNNHGDDHLLAEPGPIRQDHLLRQISGNVLVHRRPQRYFFLVQSDIHFVVNEPDPPHEGFAVVEIRGDRVLVQHAAKIVAHLQIRQQIRYMLNQIIVCAFDRGIGCFRIIVCNGMQEKPILWSPYLGIQSMLTIFPGYCTAVGHCTVVRHCVVGHCAVGHCAVHLYRHIVRFSLILRDHTHI